MPPKPILPLRYDPAGVFLPRTGIEPEELKALAPQLLAARQEVLNDVALWQSGQTVPAVKQPLDAGFIPLPEKLLAEYKQDAEHCARGRTSTTFSRNLLDGDLPIGDRRSRLRNPERRQFLNRLFRLSIESFELTISIGDDHPSSIATEADVAAVLQSRPHTTDNV